MRTAFTDLVSVPHPIVGFNRSPGVVAAVTANLVASLRAQIPDGHLAFVSDLPDRYGSVWLSSEEDVANQAIKAKFLAAASSDTVRSRTRTGTPARQLRSAWHEEWDQPGSPAPLSLPLQPMLVNEAWQRIDAAARTGHEGAVRLESFFVGQVVGSFEQIRPAGEITRQIVADCEQRIRDLGALS